MSVGSGGSAEGFELAGGGGRPRRVLLEPSAVQGLMPGGIRVPMPVGRWVRQRFDASHVHDLPGTVRRELDRSGIAQAVRPGRRIAIAAGSRGIAHLAEIIGAVVEEVRRRGAAPFIVPAMGSHGGATPEGQRRILAELGIDEARTGCPVVSSMEVMTLGHLEDGTPIYFDRAAFESDGVLVVNRVKPHTCFRGPIESGLAKMIAIGLGKHQGATALHAHGFPRFAELIPRAAHLALERAPILGGLAIVENAYQEVAHLEAIPAAAILEREPELLAMARQRMGRLPVDRLDLLIVDEIGKEISGDGMDPNVTGRYAEPTMHGGPHVQKIVVLGLTAKTHGNASGIGMADVTTQQVLDAIDFAATYTNLATSTLLAGGRIPVVMPGPEEAVSLALRTLNGVTPDQARVIRIRNTLELERIWVSEPVWEELAGRGTGEPLSEPAPLAL